MMQELVEVIWIASLATGLIGAFVLASVMESEKGHESFPSSQQVLACIVELTVRILTVEVFCKWKVAILLYPKKLESPPFGWSHHQLVTKFPTLRIVSSVTGACGASAQLIVMAGIKRGRG